MSSNKNGYTKLEKDERRYEREERLDKKHIKSKDKRERHQKLMLQEA